MYIDIRTYMDARMHTHIYTCTHMRTHVHTSNISITLANNSLYMCTCANVRMCNQSQNTGENHTLQELQKSC